ncbi:MAG TPA: sigma-70 family RNA polymerase sigma factor [Roseiarcus sp.]|nr:sigma-70 family RNA polymerase sigma factor [Roseiarcus sp.]
MKPGESDLTDLMRRVAARDDAAFRALYRQTSAKLYGIVFRILPHKDAAAEALQEAYVRIWQRAADFDVAKGSPLAWMATIARNRALDEVRRVRPASLQDMPDSFEPAAEPIDPLAARDRSERLAALIACLERLDDDKRAILMLAYYHGASREALAKRFGRPVPTIKTWLRRGLAQLRDCLSS